MAKKHLVTASSMTAEEHIRAAVHHLETAQAILHTKRLYDAKQPLMKARIIDMLEWITAIAKLLTDKVSK